MCKRKVEDTEMVEGCARKLLSQISLHSKGGMDDHFFRTVKTYCSLHAHFSYASELKNIKGTSPAEEKGNYTPEN